MILIFDMDYSDANYLDQSIIVAGTFLVRNHFDDLKYNLRQEYQKNIKEWKKQLVGDKIMERIFSAKISEKETELWNERCDMDRFYSTIKGEWRDWIVLRCKERTRLIEKEIKKFTFWKNICKGKSVEGKLNVENAREFPIGDLLPSENRQKGKRIFYKCPLHNEKTPSFVWYTESNRYKCFGCGGAGDVIDLYMKLYNCDFKSAVKALSV
jgi:hypothetical protein